MRKGGVFAGFYGNIFTLCLESRLQYPRFSAWSTGSVLYSYIIILSARWLVRLVAGVWVPIIGWLRGVWVWATVGDKG